MKRIFCGLLACTLLLGLSGCKSVFEKEYYYETPYSGDFGMRSDKATEIRNYNMLKTALTNMIINHTERGEFRFINYNGNLNEDLAAACFEIKSEHPLGAYAVETLSYDTSYVVSYYMANITIGYKRTAQELKNIVYTSAVADFEANVFLAMDGFLPELVIRCFAPGVDAAYIEKLVRRHFFDDPVTTVMEPEVEVVCYPADISSCIYEISFRYGTPSPRLIPMSMALSERIRETAERMEETEPPKQALESALYLSELCAERRDDVPYADTAYGAFVNGNADSKGLALAYRALCSALGIDCIVVEGAFGGVATEPHFWNMIALDGAYYHVDVSGMAEDPAAAFLLSDDALWGRYIWEATEYPACEGDLSYAEVAGIPEITEEPNEEASPDGADDEQAEDAAEAPDGTEPAEDEAPPQSDAAEEPPEKGGDQGAGAENVEKIP